MKLSDVLPHPPNKVIKSDTIFFHPSTEYLSVRGLEVRYVGTKTKMSGDTLKKSCADQSIFMCLLVYRRVSMAFLSFHQMIPY